MALVVLQSQATFFFYGLLAPAAVVVREFARAVWRELNMIVATCCLEPTTVPGGSAFKLTLKGCNIQE